MEEVNQEIYQQILDFIRNRYRIYIKHEDTIWFGRASFTVEMLAGCSYETLMKYPEKGIEYVVSYTFDYLCT